MKHRYASWTSALALAVATVGAGCGSDEDPLNPNTTSTSGVGTSGPTAGSTAGTTGDTTTGTTAGTTTGNSPDGSTGSTTTGTTSGTTTGTTGTPGGTTGGSTAGTTAGSTGGTTAGTTAGTTGGMSDGGMTGGDDGGPTGGMSGSCMPANSVDEDGPHTPTHIEDVGPTGDSWVYFPEDLGANGMKHPVFMWGPGAGTGPSDYLDHLNRLASHGFVVISQSSSLGQESDSLDWILAENEDSNSQFYQKIDTDRVGMGGHSMGSIGTMENADYEALNLYVLVCGGCFGGGGGCGASDIHGPTVILGATGDFGTPNYDGDYEEITAPVVFVTRSGSSHVDCARDNLAPWTAFMRWHWCGEDMWQPDFQDGGEFCSGEWEPCQSKNW